MTRPTPVSVWSNSACLAGEDNYQVTELHVSPLEQLPVIGYHVVSHHVVHLPHVNKLESLCKLQSFPKQGLFLLQVNIIMDQKLKKVYHTPR